MSTRALDERASRRGVEMGGQVGSESGAVFDEHVADEFVGRDVAATMTTMTDDPRVLHVPTGPGGSGYDAVAAFYTEHFIGPWPDDTTITRISRTVDHERAVAFLPGVAPTGRAVGLSAGAIVVFREVDYEHLCWDQTSLPVQIGLLEPAGRPVLDAAEGATLRPPGVLGSARAGAAS